MDKRIKNEKGKKYHYWEVLGFCDMKGKNARWWCRCTNCGNIYPVFGFAMRSGKSKHCRYCNTHGLD